MKYLKKFDTLTQYNTFTNSDEYILPNVSMVENDGNNKRGFCFKGKLKPYDIAGSLCYYDIENDNYKFVDYNNINSTDYPLNKFKPIGVLVIPKSHNLYGNYKCSIISLVNMNPNNPNNGGDNVSMPYGCKNAITNMANYRQIAVISNDLNSNTVIKATGFGYVPSTNIYDYFTGATVSPSKGSGLDTVSKYPSIGAGNYSHSPYMENGKFNSYYICNGNSYFNGLTGNCLSDIYGYANTNKLTQNATAQSGWKSASTINIKTTSGYYPAACCCWRFYTTGTNQGDWFLPSAGEIGYLSSRVLEIQHTLEKVVAVYGTEYATPLNMAGNYWASTFYSDVNARYLYTGIGGIGHMDKTSSCLVRAFLTI